MRCHFRRHRREKYISETCPTRASSTDINVKCRNQYEETLFDDVAITKIPICRKDQQAGVRVMPYVKEKSIRITKLIISVRETEFLCITSV